LARFSQFLSLRKKQQAFHKSKTMNRIEHLNASLFGPDNHDLFLQLGLELGGYTYRKSTASNMRNFRGTYGTRPDAMAEMYNDIKTSDPDFPDRAHPRHLCWTLMFMKMYETSVQLAGRLKHSESHIRPWVQYFARRIQSLKQEKIKLSDAGLDDDCVFVMSVDGTHVRIQEYKEFKKSQKYSSYKHGGHASFVYEIAVSIWRSKIVWVNGPFPAGKKDFEVFGWGLKQHIPEGKRVITDRSYRVEDLEGVCSCPNREDPEDLALFKSRVRARQERINAAIKSFKCIDHVWRHARKDHVIFFEACCVVCQYNMDCGDVLFDVLGDD